MMLSMTEVMSEDVLDWARDLAAIRDMLSAGSRADGRQSFAPRADRPRAMKGGVVLLMPGKRARADAGF
jgi:hypothetical protein